MIEQKEMQKKEIHAYGGFLCSSSNLSMEKRNILKWGTLKVQRSGDNIIRGVKGARESMVKPRSQTRSREAGIPNRSREAEKPRSRIPSRSREAEKPRSRNRSREAEIPEEGGFYSGKIRQNEREEYNKEEHSGLNQMICRAEKKRSDLTTKAFAFEEV